MQQTPPYTPAKKMLSFAPAPIFSGTWDHRPAVPSPLSSSPIRASSPLSPIDKNAFSQRQVQSSPIQPPKFKFASRPTRPNPVVRKREDVQEGRRKLFLENVRQKSDDRKWQRRDIEGQFLKSNWLAHQGNLSHDAPEFSEADIEDALAYQQEQSQPTNEDEMMLDDVPEEDELEAMIASYEEAHSGSTLRPPSPSVSDEEYDDIFAELISQEQSRQGNLHSSMDEMDITDGNDEMPF
ncbi:Fc.00g100990.m01.CDS01 [Cosmosporella sp. VM-42]